MFSQMAADMPMQINWLCFCGFGCVEVTSPLGLLKNGGAPLLGLMKGPEDFPWQVTFAFDFRGSRT